MRKANLILRNTSWLAGWIILLLTCLAWNSAVAIYRDLDVEFNSYPQQVSPGDTLRFNAVVTNNEPVPVEYSGWMIATHDTIPPFTFFLARRAAILTGEAREYPFDFVVQPRAVPGSYTVNGYVGIYPYEVWDGDSFPIEVVVPGGDLFALFACDGAGPGPGKQALVVHDIGGGESFQVDMEERIRGVGVSPDHSIVVCSARYGKLYVVDAATWAPVDTVEVYDSWYLGDGVAFNGDGTMAVVHENAWNSIYVFDVTDPPDTIYPVTYYSPVQPSFDDLTVVGDTIYMIDYQNDLLWYCDVHSPDDPGTVGIPGEGDEINPTAVKADRSGEYLMTVGLGSGPYFGSLSFFDIGEGDPLPIGYISVDTGNPPGDLNYRGPTDIDLAVSAVDYQEVDIFAGDEVLGIAGENAGTPGGCGGVFRMSSLLETASGTLLVPDLQTAILNGGGKLFLPFPAHTSAQPISDCALSESGIFLSCSEIGATRADASLAAVEAVDITVSGEALGDPDDVCVME